MNPKPFDNSIVATAERAVVCGGNLSESSTKYARIGQDFDGKWEGPLAQFRNDGSRRPAARLASSPAERIPARNVNLGMRRLVCKVVDFENFSAEAVKAGAYRLPANQEPR